MAGESPERSAREKDRSPDETSREAGPVPEEAAANGKSAEEENGARDERTVGLRRTELADAEDADGHGSARRGPVTGGDDRAGSGDGAADEGGAGGDDDGDGDDRADEGTDGDDRATDADVGVDADAHADADAEAEADAGTDDGDGNDSQSDGDADTGERESAPQVEGADRGTGEPAEPVTAEGRTGDGGAPPRESTASSSAAAESVTDTGTTSDTAGEKHETAAPPERSTAAGKAESDEEAETAEKPEQAEKVGRKAATRNATSEQAPSEQAPSGGEVSGEAEHENTDTAGAAEEGAAGAAVPAKPSAPPKPAEPPVPEAPPRPSVPPKPAAPPDASGEQGGQPDSSTDSTTDPGPDSGPDSGAPSAPGPAAIGEAVTPTPPVVPPRPSGPPPPADSERDPLDLLAELTNRPPPAETPARTVLRRFKIWTPLVLLLVVLLGVAQLLRPLPEPELTLSVPESFTLDGELPAVPWPESGQAALDVDGVGTFGGVAEDEQVPIASVAKTMTAYVILRDHPMAQDEDGADIPIDEEAEQDAELGDSRGDSVVDVQAGDTLSQREALQALMIASANNVAWLLARWDAGDQDAFVTKMNEAAEDLGMSDTVYTDPSGFDMETVSTAADQVKLGRAVMEDPVLRQVVGVSQYTDQYGESQYNSNILVPENGVAGIKTGSRTDTGGNFLFAARQEVEGEEQLIVGAVLAQPPDPSDNSVRTGAAHAGAALMSFAQEQLLAQQTLEAGEVVGYVDDGLGGETPVVAEEDVVAVGWPGLTVQLRLTGDDDGVPDEAEEGTEVGSLSLGDDEAGAVEVPVRLAEDLTGPDFGDRLFRGS